MKAAAVFMSFLLACFDARAMFGIDDETLGMLSDTFTTGNDLYAMPATMRASYVRGVADALMLTRSGLLPSPCIPAQATVGQLDGVVYQALAQDPSTRHHPAQFLTYKALRKAFPCPTSSPSR